MAVDAGVAAGTMIEGALVAAFGGDAGYGASAASQLCSKAAVRVL